MMRSTAFLISAALWALSSVAAEEAGTVKSVKGLAHIERANLRIDVTVGTRLHAQDRLVSGPASSVGITLNDSTLLTAGPNSTIELSQYTFDPNTRVGHMDTTVKRGTLSVVSGQMAKHKPEQVVFRTNTVTLGVRGTEFIIDVDAQIDVQK
jgi:hypothetical protein